MTTVQKAYIDRKEKIKKIRQLGWNPYVSVFEKTDSIQEALQSLGKKVKTAGKIVSFRTHGNITFADIRDVSGKIQIFLKKDILGKDLYKNTELLDIGDYIGVEGLVEKTKTGEISIVPKYYVLLTKALRPLPHEWYGLKDIETRYRKKYLDLIMNEEVKNIARTRSNIITLLREYLNKHDFLEVETPVLQPVYGGTSALPFITHHNALDADFYLRIADELYLKRLIVGGFEKVYEIGKDFRNEGLSKVHNPEFTQLEFYWAYADYKKLMKFTEDLIVHVLKNILGKIKITYEKNELNFALPWKRKTYWELFQEYLGINLETVNTEEELCSIVTTRKLIDEKVVGYGQILDKLFKKHIRSKLTGPLFVCDYPVELLPLAKRSEKNERVSASFQLLVAGTELVKAYNELNDPIEQKVRWEDDMKLASRGAQDTQVIDNDFIEALEYGMPPTAGWGMGIDRFVAIITNQHSIKDVILFPTLRPQEDTT